MCITMLNSFDQYGILNMWVLFGRKDTRFKMHGKLTACAQRGNTVYPVFNSYMITSGMQIKPGWFSDGRVLNMQMVGLKTLSHYSLYGARVVVRQLNEVCCVDWSSVNYNSETMAPFVYLLSTWCSRHHCILVTRSPRRFPLYFHTGTNQVTKDWGWG